MAFLIWHYYIAKEEFASQYEDNDHQFYDRIMENQIKGFGIDRLLLDPEVVLHAIEAQTKRIYIIGVGSSGLSAASLEKMLLRVGVCTQNHIVDPHFQYLLALLGPEDLVICFSLSGRTKDIHDSLKIAKRKSYAYITVTTVSYLRPLLP